jgi:hypothetical protein
MKFQKIVLAVFFGLCAFHVPGIAKTSVNMDNDPPYKKAWAEIEALEKEGLFKSALEKTEALYQVAMNSGNSPQIIKTIAFKSKFLRRLDEDGAETAIAFIRKETEVAPFPRKAILLSLLGEFYADYLEQHQWEMRDRTKMEQTVQPEDIKTWTIADFETAIAEAYLSSVQDTRMGTVPLKEYEAVLSPGKNTQGLWTSLQDLLTHRALEHFSRSSSMLTSPVYQFYLDQAEAFAETRVFVGFPFASKDLTSREYRALLLFQSWLKQKLADGKAAALVDAELMRLEFVYDKSVRPDKDSLYAAALLNIESRFPREPGIALAMYRRAQQLFNDGEKFDPANGEKYRLDKKRAKAVADEAVRRFPNSLGAGECRNLINRITTPGLKVELEETVLPNRPVLLSLSFQNTQRAWLRLVKLTEKQREELEGSRDEEALKFLLSLPPLRSWNTALPEDGDFQEHRTEIRVDPLSLGYYALIFQDTQFTEGKKLRPSWMPFAVSEMAFLHTTSNGKLELLVAHRDKGSPLPGVEVVLYSISYDYQSNKTRRKEIRRQTTDASGRVFFEAPNGNYACRFALGEDMLYSTGFYVYDRGSNEQENIQTHFFLDRAIYRPGQTVYFKGIATRSNQQPGDVAILPNQKVRLVFRDANYKVIAEQDLMTNAFGSFNGTFTAPTAGLRGRMTISSSLGESLAGFLVEEYKRPRFEVKIHALEGQAALGSEVKIKGEARMYAGSAADGAKVSYRVIRSATFPWWYWWRPLPPSSGETLVASGETITDASGNFEIRFPAQPDPTLDPSDLPEFRFRVEVDVTDITGETHTANRVVNLGYTNMRAEIQVGEWLDIAKNQTIGITTKNLDDQPVGVGGKVRFLALQSPERIFLKRYWAVPDRPSIPETEFRRDFPLLAFGSEDNPMNWPVTGTAWESGFNTASSGQVEVPAGAFPAGYYLLELETADASGRPLSLRKLVKVLHSTNKTLPKGEILYATISQELAEPGDQPRIVLASSNSPLHIFIDDGRAGKVLNGQWQTLEEWSEETFQVEEADRGNRFFLLNLIRYNRIFSRELLLRVPWSNKLLQMELQTFRDKLLPGQEEEWRLRISGPKGDSVAAEVLAAMYDASLDPFAPNNWSFDLFGSYGYPGSFRTARGFASVYREFRRYIPSFTIGEKIYPAFEWFGLLDPRYDSSNIKYGISVRSAQYDERVMAAAPPMAEARMEKADKEGPRRMEASQPAQVSAPLVRSNLKETVFFYPQLLTDKDGAVILKFTMNEALTRWKFQALAHTKNLESTLEMREVVTQKDLMVLPNLPRFVREGDEIVLSAKVTNLSGGILKGNATLQLFDALSMQSVDTAFGNQNGEVSFLAETGQSAPLAWRIKIPENGAKVLVVRISARAGNFSDAEENALPVLVNRMQVTETLPLYVRGGQSKTFTLNALKTAATSSTLSPLRLSVEMTSNPAWLAVKALPYLVEYPYECAEQVFSRYYANMIAGSIVRSTPKIEAVFRQWRDAGSLSSRLSQNQELKSLLLEETPWVFEAEGEEAQQKNIALLFDLNNMAQKQEEALRKLRDMQTSDGGFPWFAGGPENRYITQHIVAGMGKLAFLRVTSTGIPDFVDSALEYLDRELQKDYERLMAEIKAGRAKEDDNHLHALDVHYLYTCSYFNRPNKSSTTAFDFYVRQAKAFWTEQGVMEQGMIALALHRLGDKETPVRILASLHERALRSEELGMYWKIPRGYFWNQLPVETQSLMIETFDEAGKSPREVEEMKIWLLKNKQTNRWPSTKATADAVYALLKTGASDQWLAETKPVQVSFPELKDKATVTKVIAAGQQSTEPGTGYYKVRWEAQDIQPEMAVVALRNPNPGIAWGGLYWQYFEQLDKIKSFEETPLSLRKKYFKQVTTDRGAQLEEIREGSALMPGDKVIVRLELRVDRQMEFVHLKDMRASGLEPENPLSAYRWQGGLGYYESPGDLATHFFIDYLPRGTYVFEYPLRVNHRGSFSNGITSVQCMYAPEFSSHTAGGRTVVDR